jgi:ElaB/YqjD/DUF883 family membrane-anchored ribosome-binding protein
MARQSTANNAASEEIAAIEALMGDLEKRLRKLNSKAVQQASELSSEAGDLVRESLSDLAERLQAGAQSLSGTVSDEAGRLGNEALEFGTEVLQKIEDEIEERPLVTLAIAAGIGFLIGMVTRGTRR